MLHTTQHEPALAQRRLEKRLVQRKASLKTRQETRVKVSDMEKAWALHSLLQMHSTAKSWLRIRSASKKPLTGNISHLRHLGALCGRASDGQHCRFDEAVHLIWVVASGLQTGVHQVRVPLLHQDGPSL